MIRFYAYKDTQTLVLFTTLLMDKSWFTAKEGHISKITRQTDRRKTTLARQSIHGNLYFSNVLYCIQLTRAFISY